MSSETCLKAYLDTGNLQRIWDINNSYWLETNIMRETLHKPAFTLIELIVAITIFWVIMISVMSIFLLSSQSSQKIEASRTLQQNVKSVTEDIAESIRRNSLKDVSPDLLDDCWMSSSAYEWTNSVWSKLCLEGDIQYFLAKKDITWWWKRVWNVAECSVDPSNLNQVKQNLCRVIKRESWKEYPLTNNRVHVSKIRFQLNNMEKPVSKQNPRVTLTLTLYPSFDLWLSSDLALASKMQVQTTLSERIILHNK